MGSGCGTLQVRPVSREIARWFVEANHRHLQAPLSHKFSIGVEDGGGHLLGVLMAGRPVARGLDDGLTLEVTRCCTDGTENACSMLYGRARAAAKALGYRRLVTYTLVTEPGESLRGAGFERVGDVVKARPWSCKSRPRDDKGPLIDRQRWEIRFE